MFGLFKRKTETEKLQDRYKKLMAEWHDLSSIDRSAYLASLADLSIDDNLWQNGMTYHLSTDRQVMLNMQRHKKYWTNLTN